MIALSIAKAATELVVSMGVGTIVVNAVKATSPAKMSIANRVLVGVGGYAISGIAGSVASKHVVNEIDQAVAQIKEFKNALPSKKK